MSASRAKGIAPAYVVSTYIKESRVSGGSPFVAVVQSADLGNGHHGSHFWRLNRSRFGRVLAQREMGSRSVTGNPKFRAFSSGALKHTDLVAQSQVLKRKCRARTEE